MVRRHALPWPASLASIAPMQTLDEAAEALAAGRISAASLVDEALARIASAATRGTFTAVHADTARAQARALDALRTAGVSLGRYAGIPVTVKDLFDEAGHTTAAGSVVAARRPARAGGRPGGRATPPRRLSGHRPHRDDRVRLLGPWREPAPRHAAEPLGPRNRAPAGRLLLRRGGRGRGGHGLRRARHRHRRLLPPPRRPLRRDRLQAHGATRAPRGRAAAVALAR